MVHLYSIAVIKNGVIIDSVCDLPHLSFWQVSSGKELIRFISLECVRRCSDIRIVSFAYQDYVCYAKIVDTELSAACVTDKEYPLRVVQKLLLSITDDYDLYALMDKYKDISSVDKITAIRKELDETTEICKDVVNQLCLREDELQDLIDRTQELSDNTKIFANEAKKMNSCCTLF